MVAEGGKGGEKGVLAYVWHEIAKTEDYSGNSIEDLRTFTYYYSFLCYPITQLLMQVLNSILKGSVLGLISAGTPAQVGQPPQLPRRWWDRKVPLLVARGSASYQHPRKHSKFPSLMLWIWKLYQKSYLPSSACTTHARQMFLLTLVRWRLFYWRLCWRGEVKLTPRCISASRL